MFMVLVSLVSGEPDSIARGGSSIDSSKFYPFQQAEYGFTQVAQDFRLVASFICGFFFTHMLATKVIRQPPTTQEQEEDTIFALKDLGIACCG